MLITWFSKLHYIGQDASGLFCFKCIKPAAERISVLLYLASTTGLCGMYKDILFKRCGKFSMSVLCIKLVMIEILIKIAVC